MYRFESVSKFYSGELVIDNVSLTVPRGKTTALIGPSGSGKSTLFRLMTGLAKPDAGTIYFGDQQLDDKCIGAVRKRIGYVIQEGGLFPHMTGRANVSLMAGHLGWARDKVESRILDLMKLTRLSPEVITRYPSEMSGGQRQRVSLMRALMLEADVLLLDEPLGALDPMVRAELQQDLAEIFRRLQKTVILVTHDLAEAAYFGDQIVLMGAGRIVQSGSIADIQRNPVNDFVKQFVQAQRTMLFSGAQL
ncbi:MAG: transporter ATP-binding protein [Planctomycetaceae bacterium]|nr:transporter ATP-binding protein [Planctomycetaceae bacterium]